MTFFILACRKNDNSEWVDDFSVRYTDGATAQSRAKTYNENNSRYRNPARYRVRKVVDTDSDNLIAREAAKNHTPVPWEVSDYWGQVYYYRLPHIDPNNNKCIRFFETIEDAVECKYTSIKMASYLYRYEDFDEEKRSEILVKAKYYEGEREFGITNDAELIEEIYNNGPSSCMNDPEEYDMPTPHPAVVYSKGDLAVAYVRHCIGFTARAVVYPKKKLYYTIYGHSGLLENYLKEQGYIRDPQDGRGFEGAKIGAIKEAGGVDWLMPYVDALPYGKLHRRGRNTWFTIHHSEGDYDIRTTEGYPYYEGDD